MVPAAVLLGRPELRGSALCDPSLTRTVNLSRRRAVRPTIAVAAIETTIFDVVGALAGEHSELRDRSTLVR